MAQQLQISDNFSVTNLFITKEVEVYIKHKKIVIKAPLIKDLYTKDFLSTSLGLMFFDEFKIEDLFGLTNFSSFDLVKYILKNGFLKELWEVKKNLKSALNFLFSKYEYNAETEELSIQNIIITDEIWNYLIYVLKLIQGEKISKPLNMSNLTEAEKEWIAAQKKMERKINKIKSSNAKMQNEDQDKDIVMKIFLSIIYSFPSFSIDYLFNQTMAQIHWLQKYAAGSVSYDLNSRIFAAGNMKKGSKLEFFIK